MRVTKAGLVGERCLTSVQPIQKERRTNNKRLSLSLSLSLRSSMASLLFICLIFVSSLRFVSSIPYLCPHQSIIFLNSIQSQCPLSVAPPSPIEVDGESLNRFLSTAQRNVYTAVLFYASWCPFSLGARSTFDTLSSLFPQIRHLAVEQSLALPSIFSRYGIHSLPSILIVNTTEKVQYYGPKDLDSLAHFYKRITGLGPVQYFGKDQPSGSKKTLLHPLNGTSPKEALAREPYLVFSIFFLCVRAFVYFFPGMLSRFKAIWISYVPHLNLGIFGEVSLLLGRLFHMIDVKRMWGKMRLCRTRNFQKGAKNARVWASSLASVSLGESSLARPSTAEDS